MKKKILVAGLLCALNAVVYATPFNCPDPETSSLRWGILPAPWQKDPFSAHNPQGEANTQFVRANIMVAGLGQGVVCTYKNSVGHYSIWWPVRVKIPARSDNNWIDTLGGYVCTDSLGSCQFYVAVEE
ncbi:TPA: DUF3757 domain-containing protein [Legionella feeleii]|uniref:DUF3757 domain-containing protein n=1 Tax=Legionella feeleii TaxID=453 RepID=A0A0W0TI28_9GAMM|nr:DUF3757 domain-containing protein [Legionella feeleii]KTC95240.1 hypothetical protein Lfee_2904 [Legionella feeleii]SPX62225.1 Uncharacterised protein [Legionella feeleii]STX37848.1 Uncharacterised protein [Legionella feeleii]